MAASITLVRKTMATLTIKLTGLQSSYNGTLRVCEIFVDSDHYGYMMLQNQISSSQEYEISGLDPGRSYSIKVEVDAPNWANKTTIGPKKFRTMFAFTWSTDAQNAFDHGGKTTLLTATEWNNLVDLIEYVNPYWKGNSARATSGGAIEASMFNRVAEGVGCPTRVNKGDVCRGAYFTGLVDYINSI